MVNGDWSIKVKSQSYHEILEAELPNYFDSDVSQSHFAVWWCVGIGLEVDLVGQYLY